MIKPIKGLPVQSAIHLNQFVPRDYQLPILDAIENKGYKRVVAIMPRRSGKDMTAFQLAMRQCLLRVCVVYYIFPTYAQAKKVIWDSVTNEGKRILDYIPDELITSKNGQEMKIRFRNGSLLQLVGSDNYDCFDDQTEILSENGWKLFKDLDQSEKVATLVDGYLEYHTPTEHMEYDYDGELYAISNTSMDFRVTPNHRLFVKSGKGFYKFKEISDPTIRHDMIPSQSNWSSTINKDVFVFPKVKLSSYARGRIEERSMKMDHFVAFLGIFLGQGSTYQDCKTNRITIAQTKEHGRNKIRSLLQDIGINFQEGKDRFTIECNQMYGYFAKFGNQPTRFIPKDIKNLSKKYLQILFDWLILGDRTRNNAYTAYYSTSKQLIDDVQEIVIKLGLSGNISIRKQKDSYIRKRLIQAKHILYKLRVRKSKFKRLKSASSKSHIHKVNYRGKVYCVSVPSGVIKVRRNGKEMWSGNSLVGTNPYGVIFSEYALQDPRAYQFIRPILAANDGWALFISTPRGKNHLWELYQIALNSDDWFAYKLSLSDTDHIPMEEIDRERREGLMSEDLIQQEYYCSFDMGIEGSYYTKYLDVMRQKGQIGQVPWENGFPVSTAWDLGMSDSTCIIFFQVIGQTVRIIDCYDNNKEGLEHYVRVLESKPYSYGKHFAPHDIKVAELGTGITRLEKARQLGVKFVVGRADNIMDGIECVRSSFNKIWIDQRNCADLIKSLENYRQEFDVKRRVYKGRPLHNWASHYADSMRYLCANISKTRDGSSAKDLDDRYNEARYGHQSNMPNIFRNDLPPY